MRKSHSAPNPAAARARRSLRGLSQRPLREVPFLQDQSPRRFYVPRITSTEPHRAMPKPAITKKLTPVLLVDAIEPCLSLWVDRLGWEKTVEVPEGDKLGFVILAKDGVEVMYQTWDSVEKDLGGERQRPKGTSVGIFIEGTSIDEIEKQINGHP